MDRVLRPPVLFAIFIVVSFLLFFQSLVPTFVYDDDIYRQKDTTWKTIVTQFFQPTHKNAQMTGLYRPLSSAVFLSSRLLFGESTRPLRIIILLSHSIAAVLIVSIITKLGATSIQSFLSGILFLVMPIHTEAVANAKNGLEDVLGSTFILFSLFYFLKYLRNKRLQFSIISIFFFFLGILCKELLIGICVIYPCILYLKRKQIKKNDIVSICVALVLVCLYLTTRYVVLKQYAFGNDVIDYVANPLKSSPLMTTLSTSFHIVGLYMAKILTGVGLSATYRLNHVVPINSIIASWQAMLGFCIVVALAIFIFLKRTRKSLLSFGSIFFLGSYLPVSQLIIQGGDMMAERWMYLPSSGIAIIMGFILEKMWKKQHIVMLVLCSTIVVWYAFQTYQRSTIWKSNINLFQSMIKDAPLSIHGYYSLAQEYMLQKQYDNASKIVDKGKQLDILYVPFINVQAALAFRQGKVAESEVLYRQSLSLDPVRGETVLGLGSVLFAMKRYEEALPLFEENLLRTRHPLPEHILFVVETYKKLQRFDDANLILQKYSVPVAGSSRKMFMNVSPSITP